MILSLKYIIYYPYISWKTFNLLSIQMHLYQSKSMTQSFSKKITYIAYTYNSNAVAHCSSWHTVQHIAIKGENGISSHGSLRALHNACIVSCMLQESPSSSADFSLIKSSVETGRKSVIATDSCSIQHRTSLQWIIIHWQWHDLQGRAYKSDSCKACQPTPGVHNEQFLCTPVPMQMAPPPQRCQVTN